MKSKDNQRIYADYLGAVTGQTKGGNFGDNDDTGDAPYDRYWGS